jgi:hypothetical protein
VGEGGVEFVDTPTSGTSPGKATLDKVAYSAERISDNRDAIWRVRRMRVSNSTLILRSWRVLPRTPNRVIRETKLCGALYSPSPSRL